LAGDLRLGVYFFNPQAFQEASLSETLHAFQEGAVAIKAPFLGLLEQELMGDELFQKFLASFRTRKGLPGVVRNLGPPEVELAGRDFFSVDDREGFGGGIGLVTAGTDDCNEEREAECALDRKATHCRLKRKRSIFYHTMQGLARPFLFP